MSTNEAMVGERIQQLAKVAKQSKKRSAFFIEFPSSPEERSFSVPKLRESEHWLIGFCTAASSTMLKSVLQQLDEAVDYVILDTDKKISGIENAHELATTALKKAQVFLYSENAAWCDSLTTFMAQACSPLKYPKALVIGSGPFANQLAMSLQALSYKVFIRGPKSEAEAKTLMTSLNILKNPFDPNEIKVYQLTPGSREKFDLLIGATPKTQIIQPADIECLHDKAAVVDAGIGTLSAEAVRAALIRNLSVYRVDNRAAVTAVLQRLLETQDLIKHRMGRQVIAKIPVVAGGVMGQSGDVIIDSISKPSMIVGVADGAGRVRDPQSDDEKRNVEKLETLIRI